MRSKSPSTVESDRRAAKARALHADLEALAIQSTKLAKMTLAKWDELGQVLLEQRETMTGKAFGAWVRANHLNVGLLKNRSVISHLLDCARNRPTLKSFNDFGAVHPTERRRRLFEYRKSEYRYSVGGKLKGNLSDCLRDLASWAGQVEYWSNYPVREVVLTKELVETIDEGMRENVAAHARFHEELAKHPDALTHDPRPWESTGTSIRKRCGLDDE